MSKRRKSGRTRQLIRGGKWGRKGIERRGETEKQLKKVYELSLLAEQTAKAPKARASEKQGGFCQECRRRRDRGKGKVCENATILFQPDILQLETRSRLSSRIYAVQCVAPTKNADISHARDVEGTAP